MKGCNPKGRDCIESKATQNFNCSATCEGLHADVQSEKDKFNIISGGGSGQTFQHFSRMLEEYRTFKKNLVKSFDFKALAKSTQLGRLNKTYDIFHIYYNFGP